MTFMDDGQHIFYLSRTQGKKYLFTAPLMENDVVIGMGTQGKCFELFLLNPAKSMIETL